MKKILTVILDGFGLREEMNGNAIIDADPKNFIEIWNKYPHSILTASEEPIGLLKGQFGNSEVGHKTIGAGRKLKGSIERINDFLETDIENNMLYLEMLKKIKEKKSVVHIMGLCSDGLVHSDINHFLKLYERLVNDGVKEIYFHLITDGRDTKVNSAFSYIKQIGNAIKNKGIGSIATICGRYYAMDRDRKLDRTKFYYDLITKGTGIESSDIKETLMKFYKKNITDEFLPPIIIDEDGTIKEKDILIWVNYRTDRAKQILEALSSKTYEEFKVHIYKDLDIFTFVPIDKKIKTFSFLEDVVVDNPLGIYLSQLGLTQSRIAETEKYAHVTYFFDGEYNGNIDNCTKILVPSPKVKTYDLDPKMSAVEITKKTVMCMEKDIDFILVNFANPDMVGHTGNYDATVKAITTVDVCLGKLVEEAENNFYKVIIVSDHGNADTMLDDNNNPVTTHSLAKVPFILLDNSIRLKKEGDLTNIAPTILDYMDITRPNEMKDTESLLIK